MSVFVLRLLAMLTMLADHIAYTFLNGVPALRTVGRFAFIVYCFLLAEGYLHVRNDPQRIRKHFLRLLILTILGELAYDLAFFHIPTPTSQSVMLPLLLGYVGMILADLLQAQKVGRLAMGVYLSAAALTTYYVNTDYRFAGVLLIFAFFRYLQARNGFSFAKRFFILLAILAVYLVIYNWARFDFCSLAALTVKTAPYLSWNLAVLFTALPLALYNGKLGYSKKWFQALYVWFYPSHLLLIALLTLLLPA